MWWNRHKNKSVPSPTESEATRADNSTNDPNRSAANSEEDAVLLPPGASTDDAVTEGDSDTAPGTTAKDAAAGATTEGTTPVSTTTTPATPATPAATPAATTTTPAADAAVTPASPAVPAASAEQHPVLSAALKDGIDTDAKYATLSAEAAEGRAALATARTDAKAAAVACYGTEKPEKLTAADKMIASANSVEQLSMLAENWQAGAPGAGRARNADGSGKRTTASQAPAPGATTEATGAKPKPGTSASAGGAKPDPYAQYNANNQK